MRATTSRAAGTGAGPEAEVLPPDSGGRPRLSIALGQASITGRRERNEDFHGCIAPTGPLLSTRGICAVVADGMGGALGGLEAAQTAVRSLLSDYYSTPETWRVAKALYRVLAATNGWIHAEGRKNPLLTGMATTLSAVVLKGRQYVTAHVGDSRIYLYRDGRLKQITTDHVRAMPGGPPALSRAIGLDQYVSLESVSGELAPGDRFLLVTDGVSAVLDDPVLAGIIRSEPNPQTACDRIVQAAYEADSGDNITAQMITVMALPEAAGEELAEAARRLPVVRKMAVGDTIDGFRILELLYKGRQSLVFKAEDRESGDTVVLKFPAPDTADDPAALERFLREEWVGLRLRSPHVVRALRLPVGRRTALYYAMPYVPGEALSHRLAHGGPLAPDRVAAIGIDLARALCELHRLGIVHRDVKPENVRITPEGKAVLIDLGTVRVDGLEAHAPAAGDGPPGTPSYMAPELLRGARGGERSDVYALGVTLYHLLSGRYPYGEVEPFSRPSFTTWTPVRRHNPAVPEWLEHVLATATAKEPHKRHGKMTALLHDLEHPDSVTAQFRPMLARNPVGFWRAAFLLACGACAVLIALLARGG